MALANLKMIDGQLTLTLPAAVLQELALTESSTVDVSVRDGGIRFSPERKIPRVNLTEVLAEYEQWPQEMKDYREWVDAPRVGRELLWPDAAGLHLHGLP